MALIHIDRHLGKCLHRVCMEKHAVPVSDLTDLPNGLDRPDLIVCEHDADQDGIRPDRRFHSRRIHKSVLIHIQISHFVPSFCQIFTGVEDSMVLDLTGDDMFSFGSVRLRRRRQCPVVGLSSTRCKIDLIRLRAEHARDRLSLSRDHFFICRCKSVHTGRISIILCKIRQHRLYYFRRCLCCRRIVKIDHLVHLFLPPCSSLCSPQRADPAGSHLRSG